jgi:hypothetical protein
VPACSVSSVVMICGGHERAERVLRGGAGSGSRACAVQPCGAFWCRLRRRGRVVGMFAHPLHHASFARVCICTCALIFIRCTRGRSSYRTHTICDDHLCFYRFINTGGRLGTHTGHMDTRITQTNLTTILHAHARPRRGRSPTPLSRPNPTADSEEAAPSEPAAPGTVTADDRK